jgi:hypothetical protein
LVAGAVALAGLSAQAQAPDTALTSVYLHGQNVPFVPGTPDKAHKLEHVGPWALGAQAADPKPHDKRLNLYLIFPGKQYVSDAASEFDHNAIVNAPPKKPDAEIEWDVFYCFVLDPHLRDDITTERDLIVLAQQRWLPGDLLEFSDVPSAGALRELKKADDVTDLAQWHRKKNDDMLPRVVIVPAGFAVRGALALPPEPAK